MRSNLFEPFEAHCGTMVTRSYKSNVTRHWVASPEKCPGRSSNCPGKSWKVSGKVLKLSGKVLKSVQEMSFRKLVLVTDVSCERCVKCNWNLGNYTTSEVNTNSLFDCIRTLGRDRDNKDWWEGAVLSVALRPASALHTCSCYMARINSQKTSLDYWKWYDSNTRASGFW